MAVALALSAFVVYILPSPWRPLSETSEARIAVVAREMLRSGDWVLPQLGERSRLKKPPLPYWLVASAAWLLGSDGSGRGVTEQATVLPSAVFGALCVFLVATFGAQAFGRAAGLWAGLLLGSSVLFVRYAQLGTGEIMLTFFTACALLGAAWIATSSRPGLLAALAVGVPLGLAILTKGHIPILIVAGGVVAETLRRRRVHVRKMVLYGVALAVALAIAAPWYLAILWREPLAAQEWLGEVGSGGHLQSDRWFFYLYQFPAALLPCGLLLIWAWPAAATRWRLDAKRDVAETGPKELRSFLLGATVVGFLGFYLFPKQQAYYLLPLIPPLAVAGGSALARLGEPGGKAEEFLAWGVLVLGGLLGICLALAPWGAQLIPARATLPLLSWEWSVPLGLLAALLSFAGARQWAEGKALGAGVCLGVVVFVLQLGWTLQAACSAMEKDLLARESSRIQSELKMLSVDGPVFTVGFTRPQPVLLYYLDCKQVLGLDELLEASVEEAGRLRVYPEGSEPKPGVVLCTREVVRELGLPMGACDLQLVPLADYRREGAAFLPLRRKR